MNRIVEAGAACESHRSRSHNEATAISATLRIATAACHARAPDTVCGGPVITASTDLIPDAELIDEVCLENERSLTHMK